MRLKSKFEEESVLKFTYEMEKKNTLSFLEVSIFMSNNLVKTSLFVKSTNLGDCIDYDSICPERCKLGVIKTLLHRGYQVCSDWKSFHNEIDRIKQMLSNNNFPMQIIDKVVKEFLDKLFLTEPFNTTVNNQINFFFQNQMSSNYKMEEKTLKKIVSDHVKPVDERDNIILRIYYKTKKLKLLFIHNKTANKDISDTHRVVYQYSCHREGCNSSKYIGYTTCTVGERFRMHTQNGSIKNHLSACHDITRVSK